MRWHSRGVTTIVVTSGEMLQQLWSLIPQWYREHWLLRCRLLVVSERLAHLAGNWAGKILRSLITPTTMRYCAHYNNSHNGMP